MALTARTLDARDWALSAGTTPGWRLVTDLRRRRAAEALKQAKDALKLAPAKLRAAGCARSADFLSSLKGAASARALTEPALDYWLHLRATIFDRERPEVEWRLHYGLLGAIAAGACWAAKGKGRFETTVPPGGRITLHGVPYAIETGSSEFTPATVVVAPGALELLLAGKPAGRWTREETLDVKPGGPAARGRVKLVRLVEAVPGLVVDGKTWLINRGVEMHGLISLTTEEELKFAKVIAEALESMRRMAPGLREEMLDLTRVLVPLKPHDTMSSVSSSYVNMRGAICLSHSDSELLQAETLIHEFCHQKMNQLLEVDPLLVPGQGGQVFYSPWRADARRLRGLLLGAHAFLNVASLLLDAIAASSFRKKELVDVMLNVAIRALQVEEGLRAVDHYADLTPFGREFVGAMRRELARVHQGCLWFPKPLMKEAARTAAAHRAKHAMGNTSLHRAAGFEDKVKRAPFLSPGGVEPESEPKPK